MVEIRAEDVALHLDDPRVDLAWGIVTTELPYYENLRTVNGVYELSKMHGSSSREKASRSKLQLALALSLAKASDVLNGRFQTVSDITLLASVGLTAVGIKNSVLADEHARLSQHLVRQGRDLEAIFVDRLQNRISEVAQELGYPAY